MTHPAPRWTALCVTLLAAAWILWPDADKRAFALDRMIDAIVEARSATFDMTVKNEGQPEQSLKGMFLAPDRFRQELAGGQVNIVNWSERKMIGLDPAAKRATIFNFVKGEKPGNQFEQLRETLRKARSGADATAEPAGEQVIDGRRALGFRFVNPVQTVTIWGDAETEMPVKLEGAFHGPPRAEFTMSNFHFNVDLDESLFRIAPPEGWTVHTLDVDVSKPTEADLVAGLKGFCELGGGTFPDALTALALGKLIAKQASEAGTGGEEYVQEMMPKAITIGRGLQFAMQLPAESQAHYAGKGVKLGDATRPVLWYRPQGSGKWRVVQGDLSIREVDAPPIVEGSLELWNLKEPAGL